MKQSIFFVLALVSLTSGEASRAQQFTDSRRQGGGRWGGSEGLGRTGRFWPVCGRFPGLPLRRWQHLSDYDRA